MKGNYTMRIDHVAFEVADLGQSMHFYCDSLGFKETWRHRNDEEQEECVFLTLGDVRLELLVQLDEKMPCSDAPSKPFCPHLAIGVDDLDEVVKKLQSNGVSLLRGPLEVEGKVRWLYFTDPDQNVIELVQWFND